MATEHDPLLSGTNASLNAHDQVSKQSRNSPVGPSEVSRSTRYAILAGVWSATFLSVSVSPNIWDTDIFDDNASFDSR